MIELTGNNGDTFLVDFRYRTRMGKRPELYARSPLNAVTTCVIWPPEANRPICDFGHGYLSA
jgi:hypothetical protein